MRKCTKRMGRRRCRTVEGWQQIGKTKLRRWNGPTRDFVVPINAAGRGAIAGNPDLQVLVHDHDEGFLTPLRTA